MTHTTLSALLSHFFTDRLCTQMDASPHTIAGYRDTFRLFLRFAGERTGRAPTKLNIEDLDAELVGDFLAYVETERGNSARSRNTRLAAIRSFFASRGLVPWRDYLSGNGDVPDSSRELAYLLNVNVAEVSALSACVLTDLYGVSDGDTFLVRYWDEAAVRALKSLSGSRGAGKGA